MIKINFIEEAENASNICVFVNSKKELSNEARLLDSKFDGIISKALDSFDNFSGKFAQTKQITTSSKNNEIQIITLIGIGQEDELDEFKIQELGGSIISSLRASRQKSAEVENYKISKFSSEEFSANLAFGISLGSYSFNKYHTTKKPEELDVFENVKIVTSNSKSAQDLFESSLLPIAESVFEARNLITEPGNVLYPESYADIIDEKLSALGVDVDILGEGEMRHLGMNALLGVGQGSIRESKLVVMRYYGKDDDSAPVAFVGKGVTFDTGGISLKPSRSMGDMKYDMSGSAAVFGTIMSLAKRGAKVNAVGVVGLVENMPGGNAQRPGDVVKSMSGQTIEILDTDAEGRLVLADALWYTQEKFKPKFMVDLATLTGAVSIALGNVYAGLFSNNDNLSDELTKAGKATGEELWRLPLHSNFDKMIKSDIADVANLGMPQGHASSSTAAQFLQKFVNNVPWAHLDIAGVAYDSKGKSISPKGAVGFGIRLLNKLVKDNYEL